MKPRQDKDLHDDGIVDLRGIAILFIGTSLGFHTAIPVVILFVLSMLTFFTGLLAFLREALLATATLRIGPQTQGSLD